MNKILVRGLNKNSSFGIFEYGIFWEISRKKKKSLPRVQQTVA
jgi:hypothetical protein